ncbi:MAG: acyl-CoA ligase (AMP-forming), exosortase A system-associated, partial [Steroidobacteraceae bacterium]|nr:acyl-CoA ligase (AMP-forming), exosortase A system-associated [Steroidobacteraceae bacterium]
ALITTRARFAAIADSIRNCPSLRTVIIVDRAAEPAAGDYREFAVVDWPRDGAERRLPRHRVIDADIAAILYTSGSTGSPKGVVLSHRNIVAGAVSVSQYLEIVEQDRLVCVLPLSFDYGMNQVTTAMLRGARAVLLDHLFARDVVNAVARYGITGLAAVPPLWIQLADLEWPVEAQRSLRYFTNSGGAMPRETLRKLRRALPNARPFLMYGLTEAFRSTYLDPSEVDRRPDSIGKAIPNAEILVVRPDGSLCDVDEPGELVHRGVHVALGYWNDPVRTAERYRPVPGQVPGLPIPELAVWSGDTVRRDAEGFLYFVGRRDEMIKTSGYRVSPTEVEEAIYALNLVGEVAAFGVPHPQLGQAIVVVAAEPYTAAATADAIRKECQARLPTFMVPMHIDLRSAPLPRNPNGKIDRKSLAQEFANLFST